MWTGRAALALLLGVLLASGGPPRAAAAARGHAVGAGVAAGSSGQAAMRPGTVVMLEGTPHLWVADDQGVLHWAGDTRALAGRAVDWSNRVPAGLELLRSLPRGGPWLSAGLLKMGDPIYLVKWETSETEPRLLHIQSIADVELFGIDASNYGALVLDRHTWERAFGFSADALRREELAAVDSQAQPAAGRLAAPLPLSPGEGAAIRQNDPATGCAPHGTAGYGLQIAFEWSPVAGADGYELHAARRGAQLPIVSQRVQETRYVHRACGAYVIDQNLEGWEWRVRALGPGGAAGEWSAARTFRFEPFRR